MGGRRQVHSDDNWLIMARSLRIVARRQIVLATPNKDQSIQEALLCTCKLVLELCPKIVPSLSYKMRDKYGR